MLANVLVVCDDRYQISTRLYDVRCLYLYKCQGLICKSECVSKMIPTLSVSSLSNFKQRARIANRTPWNASNSISCSYEEDDSDDFLNMFSDSLTVSSPFVPPGGMTTIPAPGTLINVQLGGYGVWPCIAISRDLYVWATKRQESNLFTDMSNLRPANYLYVITCGDRQFSVIKSVGFVQSKGLIDHDKFIRESRAKQTIKNAAYLEARNYASQCPLLSLDGSPETSLDRDNPNFQNGQYVIIYGHRSHLTPFICTKTGMEENNVQLDCHVNEQTFIDKADAGPRVLRWVGPPPYGVMPSEASSQGPSSEMQPRPESDNTQPSRRSNLRAGSMRGLLNWALANKRKLDENETVEHEDRQQYARLMQKIDELTMKMNSESMNRRMTAMADEDPLGYEDNP